MSILCYSRQMCYCKTYSPACSFLAACNTYFLNPVYAQKETIMPASEKPNMANSTVDIGTKIAVNSKRTNKMSNVSKFHGKRSIDKYAAFFIICFIVKSV